MGDSVRRMMSNDGGFRVITVRATDTAREVVRAQGAQGADARLLAELVTASVLVRETMAPQYRVQLVAKGKSKGSAVADSHKDGMTRGLLQASKGFDFGEGSLLQVIRTMPKGQLHQSLVELRSVSSTSEALMTYMHTSEQIVSTIGVAAVMTEGEDGGAGALVAAGGYIVQLLPGLDQNLLMVMTERLEDFRNIDAFLCDNDADPSVLAGELLYGMESTLLNEAPVFFGCTCSPERVLGALATLGRSEIERIVAEGEVLTVTCEYCGQPSEVGPERLRALLTSN